MDGTAVCVYEMCNVLTIFLTFIQCIHVVCIQLIIYSCKSKSQSNQIVSTVLAILTNGETILPYAACCSSWPFACHIVFLCCFFFFCILLLHYTRLFVTVPPHRPSTGIVPIQLRCPLYDRSYISDAPSFYSHYTIHNSQFQLN